MLRKTVLSLKSPTGAFIAPLRCANANLFNKVQEKLAKNKKASARHKAEESYLLTTKLYCGKCGALMVGESGVSHTGKMYTYYKCAAAKKKKTCDKKAVRKQWLEDLVVNETMKLVEDDASMNAIIAKVMELQNQESTDLPIYEKQLKETEVGITNMLDAIQMGILTSSTKERLEALEEQRKELQARIVEERLAKPKMKEEFVRFWLLRFRKLDMTQPELCLYFGVCILQQFQQSSHRDGRFACSGYSLRAGAVLFSIEAFLELPAQLYTGGLLDMGVGVHQHICRSVSCGALNGLHIAAGDHQLIRRTGIPQTVEHNTRELRVCILPFQELLADEHRLHRQTGGQTEQHSAVMVACRIFHLVCRQLIQPLLQFLFQSRSHEDGAAGRRRFGAFQDEGSGAALQLVRE